MRRWEFTRDEALLLLCLYFEFDFINFDEKCRKHLDLRVSTYSTIFRIMNTHNVNLDIESKYRNYKGISLQVQSIRYYHLSIEGYEPHGVKNCSQQFKNLLFDVLNDRISLPREKSRILEKLVMDKCTESLSDIEV